MSIDFLTGMTIFALTLIFALGFMFDTAAPVTLSEDDTAQIADRSSTALYSSITEENGVLDKTDTQNFFGQSTSDMKRSLGMDPDRYGINITVRNATGVKDNLRIGSETPDVSSVSTRRRVVYSDQKMNVQGATIQNETLYIKLKVWRG